MARQILTHLMFEGAAEEAMNFYVSLFEDAAVTEVRRYGPGEAGQEGSVMMAYFRLRDRDFICIDSPIEHGFTFTPAMSVFVECEDEAELERLFAELSSGGQVMMPLDDYGFSRRYGWVCDRFKVSWQLNLQ